MGGITLTHKSTNRISGHLPGNSLTLSNPEGARRSRVEVHLDSAWFDVTLKALNQRRLNKGKWPSCPNPLVAFCAWGL